MLYVFHVDTGLMLTFDMNLAMESVSKLQEAISTSYNIPPEKQVMLISGGENLDPAARVCSYSAGTDTNPIFLFSRTTIESATPPSASVNYGSDTGLQDQVEGSLNMGPTYETVVARAQLALQIHDVGREELRVCERLVHDQHLQHQGWAAVVANLEDITSAFKKRSEALWGSFDEFVASRERHIQMLDNFENTLELLRKIPLLPCLAGEHHRLWTPERNSAASSTPSDSTTAGSSSTLSINKSLPHDSSTCSANLPLDPTTPAMDDATTESLFEWISAQDSRSTMETMIQQCQQSMQQFTTEVKEQLISDMHTLLEAVNNPSMKEVKGLEDRLYGLEQLMYGARKLVQEQHEMAQGFVQNQNRASNLRDTSILPDLCQSHKRQLLVMLKNHQSLRDIKRRCTAAKDELAANLHTRLRWIMYVEKSLCDKDNKLMIHQATLRKLKRRLVILQQMNDAPNVYARAVVEVVRRKSFSQNFLQWANTLASESSEIHEAEVGKREEFYSCIERHFLKTLFPGLDDVPVPYATKAPYVFDTKLPPITSDDISFLREKVPELAEKLIVPEDDESVDKLSDMTGKAGIKKPGVYAVLATTLQNTLQTASQATLKSSGQSVGEGSSQAPNQDDGTAGKGTAEGEADVEVLGSTPKDDMCTSDIVVLTHEMSLQASEGGTLTDAGTVRLHTDKPLEASAALAGPTTVAISVGDTEKAAAVCPASPAKSDLNQSVEVLCEEEAEEEEEFLSLQAEGSLDSAPEVTSSAAVAMTTTAPPQTQHVVVVEPKLKNSTSTSGSSAELVARGGSSGSLRTMAPSPGDRRGEQLKSTPETSPSLEEVNSEGFTTADFYIDESMPSSMTESPPTKKMVAELQMVLHDKSAQLDAKERDLEQHRRTLETAREKLNQAEDNLKLLQDTAEKGTLQLKCDILSMEKQITRDKDEFSNYMESVAKKLLDVIEKFEKQQTEEQQSAFNAMKVEKENELAQLTERLEVETQKLRDAQDEIEIYHKQLKDREEKHDSLVTETTAKLAEVKEQWRLEVEETRKGLMLEHEIEIERSQEENKIAMEQKEMEISALMQDLVDLKAKAQEQVEEVTEKLQTDFEVERKELAEKVHKEYQEKKESLELEIKELLSKAHQAELEAQTQEHEQQLQRECERLKAELSEEKTLALAKTTEELEQKFETERLEWQAKAEADLASIEKENQKVLNDLHDSHTKALEELQEKQRQEISDLESQHSQLLAGVDRQHDQALGEAASEHQIELNNLVDAHQREVAQLREQLMLEKLNELQSLQQHFEEKSHSVKAEPTPEAPLGDDGTRISVEEHEQVLAKVKEDMDKEHAAALEKALCEQRKLHEAATERLVEQLDKDKPDSLTSSSSISAAAEKQIAFNEALSKVVAEKDKIIEDLKAREALLSQQREEDQCTLADVLAGKMGEDGERDAAVKLARDREEQLRQLRQCHEEELAAAQAQVRAAQDQVHMTTSGASSGSVISAASSPHKVAMQVSAPLSQAGLPLSQASASLSQASAQLSQASAPLSQASTPQSQASAPLPVLPQASSAQLSQSVFSQSVFSQSAMASSIMPFSEPSCSVSMYERIQELETNLKTKEEEMAEMNQKLRRSSCYRGHIKPRPRSMHVTANEMQMSMSTSARAFVQDKVSITTCNVGDVVLLCLDERHDHYVVFNMGTTLHFLHSDCLDTLGLKTAGAEARKSWVLAEIVDKEYCQAKKAQNRFRVPLGTKFYRVKAKSWDREAALQREVAAAQRDSPSKVSVQH